MPYFLSHNDKWSHHELEAALQDADLVITGEGRIDSQTIHGKTPFGVARMARRHDKPVIGILKLGNAILS